MLLVFYTIYYLKSTNKKCKKVNFIYTFILLIGNTSEYPLKMYFLSLHHKHDGSITRGYKQKLTHSLPGSVYKILVL